MDIKDKSVLVTGGAGGVGQALAKIFLTNGAKVCIGDINTEQGKEVVKSLQEEFGEDKVIFTKLDVTKDQDFEDAFNVCEKEFGAVKILINNAGIITNDREKMMDVNFGGVVRGTELALKRMGKDNGGKGGFVVNTGSIGGLLTCPYMPLYTASKAAVIHYTRCIGHEFHYNYTGVGVFSLCATFVDTSMLNNPIPTTFNNLWGRSLQNLLNSTPKLTPMEVAEAALKLIKDNKSGSALAVEKNKSPYYVSSALQQDIV